MLLIFLLLNPSVIFGLSSQFDKYQAPSVLKSQHYTPQYIFDTALSVHCNITGFPDPVYSWFSTKDIQQSELIKNNDRILRVNPNGSNNLPKNFTEGAYYCQASNILGTIRSPKFVFLKVSQVKSVKITYESMPAKQNSKAVIKCNLHNDIEYFYEIDHWVVQIDQETPFNVYETRNRFSVIPKPRNAPQLHIRNVTKTDFGKLKARCVLRHKFNATIFENAGQMQWAEVKTYDMTLINGLESINYCSVTNITVYKGETAELPVCHVFSIDESMPFSWYFQRSSSSRSESVAAPGGRFTYPSTPPHNRKIFDNLIIRNAQLDDAGYYYVRNTYTNSEMGNHKIHLNVNEKLIVKVWPDNPRVNYGKTISLGCSVIGRPKTNIYWLHNGKFLQSESVRAEREITFKLEIEKVDISKIGVYQCVAEWWDTTLKDSAQADVVVSLESMAPLLISQNPPMSSNSEYSKMSLTHDQDNFKFSCKFAAVPPPNITWYRDNMAIPMNDTLQVRVSPYPPYYIETTIKFGLDELSSLNDKWKYGGMYRAVAYNKHGQTECNGLVFVSDVFRIRDIVKKKFYHGEKIVLYCNVISASEPVQIYWYKILADKTRQRLPETGKELLSFNKRKLTIYKAEKWTETGGQFECVAEMYSNRQSRIFNVSIIRKPSIREKLPNRIDVDLKVQKHAVYYCSPEASTDEPWYAWWEIKFHNMDKSVVLAPLSRHNKMTRIPHISVIYSMPVRYSVYSRPKVPSELLEYGGTFSKINLEYTEKFEGALLTCNVRNLAGSDKKEIPIRIINPQFAIQPNSSVTVTVGQSFYVNCVPKKTSFDTKTQWKYSLKNEAEELKVPIFASLYAANQNKAHIFQLKNGSLVVLNVRETDPTLFTCVVNVRSDDDVTNSKGTPSTISKVTKVTINVPARIHLTNQIDLRQNRVGLVNCTVRGDRNRLNISWRQLDKDYGDWRDLPFKTEKYLVPDKKVTIESFIIDSVIKDYAGQYKCIAKNKFNKEEQSKITTINVVDIPGEVTTIRNNGLKARSIELIWDPPEFTGNKPILGYLVEYMAMSEEEQSGTNDFDDPGRQLLNTTTNKATLTKLRPNTNYKLAISAYNQVGIGSNRALLHVYRTMEAAPEGQVQNLIAMATSSTSIQVSWRPPKKHLLNGELKGYRVCYELNKNQTLLHSPPIKIKSNCSNITEEYKQYEGLPKFTEFLFTVTPYNKIGNGPSRDVLNRTLEDAPEKEPQQVRCQTRSNSTTLEIFWNPPPPRSINGIIQYYQIDYYSLSNQEEHLLQKKVPRKTHAVLTDLRPYTTYSFQVRAVNNKSPGPVSAPVECTTDEAAPTQPNGARALIVNKCLHVAWLPPHSNNGLIRQYCFLFLPANKKDCYGIDDFNTESENSNFYYYKKFCDLFNNPRQLKIWAENKYKGVQLLVNVGGANSFLRSISRNITVNEGDDVTLDCDAINSDIYWKSGPAISALNQEQSLLKFVATLQLAGTYVCVTKQHEGQQQQQVHHVLHVRRINRRVPNAPRLVYTNSTINSIFIQWRLQVNRNTKSAVLSPIKEFVVSWNTAAMTTKDNQRTLAPDSTHFNITKLDCGLKYIVRISATNEYGSSEKLEVFVTTKGTAPLFPSNLSAISYPNSICFALFQFLPGSGCSATSFTVTLSPSNQGRMKFQQYSKPINFDAKSLVDNQCTNISNLHTDTSYNYNISAINSAGVSSSTGTVRTAPLIFIPSKPPNIDKSHAFNMDQKYYWIIGVGTVVILVFIVALFCILKKRRDSDHSHIKNTTFNNNLQHKSISYRERKLPSPPKDEPQQQPQQQQQQQQQHQQAIETKVTSQAPMSNDTLEDTLEPYAFYMPTSAPKLSSAGTSASSPLLHQHQVHMNNQVGPAVGAYTGSQAHTYQYPDHGQQPVSTGKHSATLAVASSHGIVPASSSPRYSGGYATGRYPLRTTPANTGTGFPNLFQQPNTRPPPGGTCDSETYRPSSSTTASSTKEELSQFIPSYSDNMSSRFMGNPTLRLINDHSNSTLTGMHSQVPLKSEATLVGQPDSVLLEDEDEKDETMNDGISGTDRLFHHRMHPMFYPSQADDDFSTQSYQSRSIDDSSAGEHPVTFTSDPTIHPLHRPTATRPNPSQTFPHNQNSHMQLSGRIAGSNAASTLSPPHNMGSVNEDDESNQYTNQFVLV